MKQLKTIIEEGLLTGKSNKGYGYQQALKFIHNGTLKAKKLGNAWFVDDEEVERFNREVERNLTQKQYGLNSKK